MTLRAIRGYCILEYTPPEEWKDCNGIFLPSASQMRDMLRRQESKTLSIDEPPPDLYRWGKVVAGMLALGIPKGSLVYYNRHEVDDFELEGVQYVRLKNELAIAYYVSPNTTPVDDKEVAPVIA